MSEKVQFYTVSIVNDNKEVSNCELLNFFDDLESSLKRNVKIIKKQIDNNTIRIFKYYRDDFNSSRRFVIPFGKRNASKPYSEQEDGIQLGEIDRDVYDINSLYFNADERVVLLTTNRFGPSYRTIQTYLSEFLPKGISVNIVPIEYNRTLEDVRKTKVIRGISINIDLGCDLNKLYKDDIEKNRKKDLGIIEVLSLLGKDAKNDLENNTLTIELGMGRQRNTTMNVDNAMYLLDELNLQSDCIKEVVVHYIDKTSEKIEAAKLKKKEIIVYHKFNVRVKQISPDYLNVHGQEAVDAKRKFYLQFVSNYFDSCNHIDLEYKFIENTENEAVLN